MKNIPEIKLGIIAVSRDCFPIALSEKRRKALVEVLKNRGVDVYECPVIIEGGIDKDVMAAYNDLKAAGVNALTVFLGNFGPEGPETDIAKLMDVPCIMVHGRTEEGFQVWNMVRVDKLKWYHADAAADDKAGCQSEFRCKCLFRTDKEMRATHAWDPAETPPTPQK